MNENKADFLDLCLGVAIGLLFGLIPAICFSGIRYRNLQIQAVERGVARWDVAIDGTTTFKWNGDKKQ